MNGGIAHMADLARVLEVDARTVKRMALDGRAAALGCPPLAPVSGVSDEFIVFKRKDVLELEERLSTSASTHAAAPAA